VGVQAKLEQVCENKQIGSGREVLDYAVCLGDALFWELMEAILFGISDLNQTGF